MFCISLSANAQFPMFGGGNRVNLNKESGILLALDINDGPSDVPNATNNFYSDIFRMAAAVLRVKHILGGITGDILGLVCEVSQLVFLFVCVLFSARGLL